MTTSLSEIEGMEKWNRIDELFAVALELPESSRLEHLREQCDGDEDLFDEVRTLIESHQEAENVLEKNRFDHDRIFIKAADRVEGRIFGNYRVVEEIGSGGMGAVYLAERADGKFSQRVALKLLKREMNTIALRGRFQQEREILARLEHPNIARLLDAGTTDDRIPFLVMEYVEGEPLDIYCSKHELDLRSRLELFRQVCSTVDFAHRNLIVHRDLKPSNILVTKDGVPKLLDFGISKILSTGIEASDASTVTRLGAMTLSYASPEQLRSETVTTASDVYSLGVMLYELLCGHRPFEGKEKSFNEIHQAVVETDPPMPSVMVDTGSHDQRGAWISKPPVGPSNSDGSTQEILAAQTSPQFFGIKSQYLRGDLDNIVLKAMKKEPERRYLSPEHLSEDIRRHLDGLPVTARPDTFRYRSEKFLWRHRFAAVAGALLFLATFVGLGATLWQARIARSEGIRAENRFNDVRKLANSYLFDVYPEIEKLEGSLKAREIIVKNALEYLDSLSSEAVADVDLQLELATAYEKIGDVQGASNTPSLGDHNAAIESYQKAQRLREDALATDPSSVPLKRVLAQNYQTVAKTHWHSSNTAGAEEFYERALKLRREVAAAAPTLESQNELATLLLDFGAVPAFNFQTERAIAMFDESLAIIKDLLIKNPDDTDLKRTLARGLRAASQAKTLVSDFKGALDGLAQAVVITNQLIAQFPNDYRLQRTGWINDYRICEAYIQKEDGAKAIETCIAAIPFNENTLKKEPNDAVAQADLATSYFNAARAHRIANDPAGVISYAEKAIAIGSKLAKRTPKNMEMKRNIAIYETEIARAQLKLNQPDRALKYLQKIQNTLSVIIESDKESTTFQYDLALAHRMAAEAYFKLGDRSKAVNDIDKAITLVRKLRELNSLKAADKDLVEVLEKEKADYNRSA